MEKQEELEEDTNGPALNNTKGPMMPTDAHGPDRKKKKKKKSGKTDMNTGNGRFYSIHKHIGN